MKIWMVLGFMVLLVLQPEIKAQDCGLAPLNSRIVGGEDASAGAWPWQVSMHITVGANRFHTCGGTVINTQWVMTAAHCISRPITASAYTLFFGRLTQSGPNPNEVNRTVTQIILHPGFNSTTFINDIALMRLSSAITYTNFIRPVCLAANSSLFHNGTLCWATGWGRLNNTEPNQAFNDLQEVQIPVIGNNECRCTYDARNLGSAIRPFMICAGETGRGVCQGDSGGPVQCKQGNQWIQAGIASFGIPCAIGFPEVFARVSSYQSWILNQTAGTNVSFVEFRSAGTDADSSFVCSNTSPSTSGSTSSPDSASTHQSELVFVGTVAMILLMSLFT